MIAFARALLTQDASDVSREQFESMIDAIREKARFAFRHKAPEERDEFVQEVVANAWVAFCRLCSRGKADLAYPTPLADFAIRQVRAGRRVGAALNSLDASSPCAAKKHGFCVSQLERFDRDTGAWKEIVVEDRRTPVPDQAAFRVDFSAWLATLCCAKRKIAMELAAGFSTSETAGLHGLTPGRVSQVRRELDESWCRFHGEPAAGDR